MVEKNTLNFNLLLNLEASALTPQLTFTDKRKLAYPYRIILSREERKMVLRKNQVTLKSIFY